MGKVQSIYQEGMFRNPQIFNVVEIEVTTKFKARNKLKIIMSSITNTKTLYLVS